MKNTDILTNIEVIRAMSEAFTEIEDIFRNEDEFTRGDFQGAIEAQLMKLIIVGHNTGGEVKN